MSVIAPGIYGHVADLCVSDPTVFVTDDGNDWTDFSKGVPVAQREQSHSMFRDKGRIFAVAGSPYWADKRLNDLQMRSSPAEALKAGYLETGEKVLDLLRGAYVLFLGDPEKRFYMIAVDRFARIPLCWHVGDRGLVFSPNANDVAEVAGGPVRLSSQSLYNYVFFHMVPAPDSVFSGVHRLRAAHKLIVNQGKITVSRYWTPTFSENARLSYPETKAKLLGTLQKSITDHATGADTGAFLSGGLDSSTVAGMLARNQDVCHTYSIGFDVDGYDETPYARKASEHFATHHHEYFVTPEDVLDALPKVAAAYDEPFGNSSAIPAFFCAQLAKNDGRKRLLAGDGGDELFAGNARYAKQAIFEHYQKLPEWIRHLFIEPGLAATKNIPVLQKLRSYVRQANVSLPARLHTYNFLHRHSPSELFFPEFLEQVDIAMPYQLESEIYQAPEDASALNRMLYLDWYHTLADNDLRKVSRMCQLVGIEVAYPMLDDFVVDCSLEIPSAWKLKGNRLRDFYKKTVKDFLPAEIIDKSKHGFGLPFGIWMAEHAGLQQLAGDCLSDMRKRNIVRSDFLDKMVKMHRDQHAGYYGELVWLFVMLELWMSVNNHTV